MIKCKACGVIFNPSDSPRSSGAKRSVYCSKQCRAKYSNLTAWRGVAAKIDGDWGEYFKRTVQKKKAIHKDKMTLTVEDLFALYEKQKGKCALTGRDLQCRTTPGVPSPENASLDRIVAGGTYSADNVQLVCRDVNGFRSDTPLKNFIHICCLVAEHATKKRV